MHGTRSASGRDMRTSPSSLRLQAAVVRSILDEAEYGPGERPCRDAMAAQLVEELARLEAEFRVAAGDARPARQIGSKDCHRGQWPTPADYRQERSC
jgi:hypothetical protein